MVFRYKNLIIHKRLSHQKVIALVTAEPIIRYKSLRLLRLTQKADGTQVSWVTSLHLITFQPIHLQYVLQLMTTKYSLFQSFHFANKTYCSRRINGMVWWFQHGTSIWTRWGDACGLAAFYSWFQKQSLDLENWIQWPTQVGFLGQENFKIDEVLACIWCQNVKVTSISVIIIPWIHGSNFPSVTVSKRTSQGLRLIKNPQTRMARDLSFGIEISCWMHYGIMIIFSMGLWKATI